MSIKLENISKVYGKQYALTAVSLSIKAGEIVGLLGPNGAGKSTLMKIISGYIPPTEGTGFVKGFNLAHEGEKAKALIGYLPENNALYNDMYVREYLAHIAQLYGQKKGLKKSVDEVIKQCGLEPEQNKKIGILSKGYKQRVGLAQALIHKPEVLILDEPTSGLDPNQLIEIRNLIKEVGKEKTVLLSTHIMQEVEAICDRVIIIHKGKVIADDLTENLSNYLSDNERIILELDHEIDKADLEILTGVESAIQIDKFVWEIQSNRKDDLRQQLFEFAVRNHYTIRSMQKKENSLERIFQELTQR
ncbi:MAG TPA: gliding motility-associated ABC transporter ATP-binding subunit GldA [Bacteroidales bacterium]|nr:gliding motility-associated ABC transporter ATP-binding subunit GldA [Bacteroidales bacterium]